MFGQVRGCRLADVRELHCLTWRVRVAAIATIVASLCGSCAPPIGGSVNYFNSYMNQTPPELSATGTWINSQETLSLAALRGRVVWLEFSFLH